jgi:hypothetical protein
VCGGCGGGDVAVVGDVHAGPALDKYGVAGQDVGWVAAQRCGATCMCRRYLRAMNRQYMAFGGSVPGMESSASERVSGGLERRAATHDLVCIPRLVRTAYWDPKSHIANRETNVGSAPIFSWRRRWWSWRAAADQETRWGWFCGVK